MILGMFEMILDMFEFVYVFIYIHIVKCIVSVECCDIRNCVCYKYNYDLYCNGKCGTSRWVSMKNEVHVYMYICAQAYPFACMPIYMYVCIHVCMYNIFLYTCMYISSHICMYFLLVCFVLECV